MINAWPADFTSASLVSIQGLQRIAGAPGYQLTEAPEAGVSDWNDRVTAGEIDAVAEILPPAGADAALGDRAKLQRRVMAADAHATAGHAALGQADQAHGHQRRAAHRHHRPVPVHGESSRPAVSATD